MSAANTPPIDAMKAPTGQRECPMGLDLEANGNTSARINGAKW